MTFTSVEILMHALHRSKYCGDPAALPFLPLWIGLMRS